jgi:4a-hydroxytetrahydrobiopterin dehydratase
MKDFKSAVSLIDALAVVAEREDHHPDVHLTGYRRLRIELATHSIGGLSLNDFILAAKIERLPNPANPDPKQVRPG